jgi:hypothetical protein
MSSFYFIAIFGATEAGQAVSGGCTGMCSRMLSRTQMDHLICGRAMGGRGAQLKYIAYINE